MRTPSRVFRPTRFRTSRSSLKTTIAAVAVSLPLLTAMSAGASETQGYTYDARGRLTQVSHSGTVNNGVNTSYTLDKADNRTNFSDAGGTPTMPTFSVSDASVTEGGSLIFTVSKAGNAGGSLTVDYATANGTATAGSDYTASSGTLTFAQADTALTVTVPTTDDSLVESAETLTLNLSNAAPGSSIGDGQGIGKINDNDVAPTCSGVSFTIASNGAVTEGLSSGFTITKTGTATGSCNVNYATANGTATQPGDYTSASGTLTFTSAQTSKPVSVPTVDDSSVEGAETFSMALSAPTGGAVLGTPNNATATINDNDTVSSCSGVSFAVNDTSTFEGDPLVFTVTKAGGTSSNCSVNYATANGTAIGGTGPVARYVITSGTLTFTASQTSQTVSVTTHFDNATRTDSMFLNLSGATGGATISDSQGVGTIKDAGN